jgi:hypothetical protein
MTERGQPLKIIRIALSAVPRPEAEIQIEALPDGRS